MRKPYKVYYYPVSKLWEKPEIFPGMSEELRKRKIILGVRFGLAKTPQISPDRFSIGNVLTAYVGEMTDVEESKIKLIYENKYVTSVWIYFCQNYFDQMIIRTEEYVDAEDPLPDELAISAISDIISIIFLTYDRYYAIIKAYDDKKQHLLDTIKTETRSRYNDTPQNELAEDDIYADEHATNTTRSTSETDTTAAERLKELENSLSDIYRKWAREIANKMIYWSV